MILGKLNIPFLNSPAPPATSTTRIILAEWLAGGNLFYSDDFGLNWTTVSNPSTNGMPSAMDINPNGLGVVAMNRNANVDHCYTLDYGETLNIIPGSSGGFGGNGAYVSKDGSVMMVNISNGTNNDLRVSINGGSSWITKGTGNYDAAVIRGNEDGSLIFFADNWRNPGIFKSTNQGDSWTKIKTLERTYSFSTSESCQYMACSVYPIFDKFYTSNDYGVTWTIQTISPATKYHPGVNINDTGQYQSLFGGNNDFYYSDDYGATFVKKNINISVANYNYTINNRSMSKDGKIILGSSYSQQDTYYTLDRGDTWTALPLPNSQTAGFRAPLLIEF